MCPFVFPLWCHSASLWRPAHLRLSSCYISHVSKTRPYLGYCTQQNISSLSPALEVKASPSWSPPRSTLDPKWMLSKSSNICSYMLALGFSRLCSCRKRCQSSFISLPLSIASLDIRISARREVLPGTAGLPTPQIKVRVAALTPFFFAFSRGWLSSSYTEATGPGIVLRTSVCLTGGWRLKGRGIRSPLLQIAYTYDISTR